MAVAPLGKCFVLSVLILFVYVTYGFRIRDADTEPHGTCHAGLGKCSHVDGTRGVSSIVSKQVRIDGTHDEHTPLRTGRVRRSVELERIREKVKVKNFGQLKERNKFEIRADDDDQVEIKNIDDAIDDNDDEESDVIIEDASSEENVDDDDDDDDDDGAIEIEEVEEIVESESIEDEDSKEDTTEKINIPELSKGEIKIKDKYILEKHTIIDEKTDEEETEEVTLQPKNKLLPKKTQQPVLKDKVISSANESRKVRDTSEKVVDKSRSKIVEQSAVTQTTTVSQPVLESDSPKVDKASTVTKKKDKDKQAKVKDKVENAVIHDKTKKEKSVSKKQSPTKSPEIFKQTKDNVKPGNSRITLSQLNDEILQLPNFVPNFTTVQNAICQQHGNIFLRQLRAYKLWALQMLDSSAKVPAGLLRGNVNQLGDFDQCLGIMAHVKVDRKTVQVQGKYCLANIDIEASLPDMQIPTNLIRSRSFLKGTMRDPGHFVPKFTTINWALCIPRVCTAIDAREAIENSLSQYNMTTGLKFIVDVNNNMCYVRQRSQKYSKETLGVLYFYAMIVCLVFVATLRDYFITTPEKANYSERIIMSFSLWRTTRALMKTERSDSGEISCIHGIRSIAMMALYVGHKMIPIAGTPYANRIDFTEAANNPLSSVLRVSVVYTDSFLLLSGVLSAYNMSKEATTRGEIRWFCRFIARFIRLTPALLAVIFWYAFVMEHVGSGPQWNIIKANADLCKQNAWVTLLYMQNFLPFEEMCATHTHQLALDMQMSLLAPILVFFLQIKPVIGVLVIFFLLQVSATIRYFATTSNYLSLVIFHGMTSKQLYRTANYTYAVTLHRLTPYLFGIGLGVLMHHTGKKLQIHKILVILGWIVAILLGMWSLFSPWPMAKRDYIYDIEASAHYAVVGPVCWALALCWIIFACFTRHGGLLNSFLSNYWLTVFSRISYSFYLTQFAVFFHNLAMTRYSSGFQVHRVIDFYEVLTVIGVSTLLTLFFDIPMQEVRSVLMEYTDMASVVNHPEVKSDDMESHKTSKTPVIIEATSPTNSDSTNDIKEYWKSRANEDRDMIAKRRLLIHPDNSDEWPEEQHPMDRNRRNESVQGLYEDPERVQFENSTRYRDSSPRRLENYRSSSHDPEIYHYQRERSISRTMSRNFMRQTSGSEDERRGDIDEDWEQELRIRRRRLLEQLSVEEQGTQEITRRSSAEGKIALLSGSAGVMDAWTTVNRGSRVLHSDTSQELLDADEGFRSYDDSNELPKFSISTSVETMELSNDDMSEPASGATLMPAGKLFKRESIVKSQASEEDPEYLLPERPKLVKQQQEHPFKKAWQIQKSRSEEDGPSAFAIKEIKTAKSTETISEEHKSTQQLPSEIPFEQFEFDKNDVTHQLKNGEDTKETKEITSSERDSEDNESDM